MIIHNIEAPHIKRKYQTAKYYAKQIDRMKQEHEKELEKTIILIDSQQQQIIRLKKENESLVTVIRRLCNDHK